MSEIQPMDDKWLGELRERVGGPIAISVGCNEVECLIARLDAEEAAREKAEGVIATLPKTGDDQPALLGANLYAVKLSSVVVRCGYLDLAMEEIDAETVEFWGTVRDVDGAEWRVRTTDTYSTPEAAEAALGNS